MNRNYYGMPNPGIEDLGPEPTVLNLNCLARQNPYFRTALWTGDHLQITLMSIPVCGEIGLEMHTDFDQFIRIESGSALVMMGKNARNLDYRRRVDSSYGVVIPAGTWHNIVNVGNVPLKLYSVYAPPEHPYGTVHKTKQEAEEAERYEKRENGYCY